MRLSEVKGERTFEVLAAIAEPVASIMSDEELSEAVKASKENGESGSQRLAALVAKALPILVGKHRDNVVTVLSAIEGTPRDKYLEGLDLKKLANDVTELLTDDGFLDFLPSGAGEPGTSSESTGE